MQLLIHAGYDNALSVVEIDESDIKLIEEFAEKKSQNLLTSCDIYSEVKPFQFLPGHKKLIHSLPQKVHQFKNKKCRKNLFAVQNVTEESIEQETIELLTNSEVEGIKAKLLLKLNKSPSVIEIKTTFTATELGAIEPYISQSIKVAKKATKSAYKCVVKCMLCEKCIPCIYNSFWQISNLDKHMKIHIEESKTANDVQEKVGESTTTSNNHSINSGNNTAKIQQIDNVNEVSALLGLSNVI